MENQELGSDGKPILAFETSDAWREWLDANHASSRGVWVRLAKKGSGVPSVTYAEAVEEAICFGWIDGQMKSEGVTFYIQKITPRGKRSIWSKRNCERVLAPVEAGRMAPAGLAEVERAQADGRWQAAYDSPRSMSVPEDLQSALQANPVAREAFERLDSQNRYAILFRLQTAKRQDTREKRIRDFVSMLERGERIHP